MNYKKIIKNQGTRFRILRLMRFVPDKAMISFQYILKLGRKPNIENPARYTEKLQWYKLYYRTDLMTQCADKYTVREYVKIKNLEHTLNKLYAVYENVEEINFDALPEKFVMKTTNGSGTNYFCTDKSNFDVPKVKK